MSGKQGVRRETRDTDPTKDESLSPVRLTFKAWPIVTGVTIVRAAFADEHPELIRSFLDEYKASIEYVNAHPDEMGPVVETYIDTIKGAVAKKAIPACNIAYLDGSDMKQVLESYLSVLYALNPSSVGGAMPAADFYYGADAGRSE